MRIGFDATVLSRATRYTGTGQYAEKLLQAMARAAPDFQFLAYSYEGSPPGDDLWPANIAWRRLMPPPVGKLSAIAGHLWTLPRLVKKDNVQVLHVPTVHTRPSLPPVPSRLTCPIVVTVHDIIPITFYEKQPEGLPRRLRWFYRWNLRRALRASRVITVSEHSRTEIVDCLRPAGDRISVIYNGVDSDFWSPGPVHGDLTPSEPYVLFAGSYEPRKNLHRLLLAFDSAVAGGLPHRLVMVVDAGSGHEPALRAEAAKLACNDRLQFLSGVPEEDLRELYREADMLAFPSLSDGFGLPPVQALATGTPVLASDIAVMREILGGAADYCDPFSVPGIAAGIIKLAGDPAHRECLSRRGLTQARIYTWERAAQMTLDVYRGVIEETGRR